MLVNKNELLDCKSYIELCDYDWEGQEDVPAGLVHVNIEHIPSFFQKIKEYPDRQYVVVSSCSDFGLCYQEHSPVWDDLRKWVAIASGSETGYQGVTLAPRCNLETCNEKDKYSIKSHCWTQHTFNEIPENVVHWFTTNCGIVDDERVSGIPFGVAENTVETMDSMPLTIKNMKERPKDLYCNWTFYTYDRYKLAEFFSKTQWATVHIPAIDGFKKFADYLIDLATHKFVVCPPGNGADCYRIYEALAMGAVPIVQQNSEGLWLNKLELPIVFTTHFELITPNTINNIVQHNEFLLDNSKWSLSPITKSYWKEKFEEKRKKESFFS